MTPDGIAFDLEAYDDYVQNMKIANCRSGVFIDGPSGGKDGVIRYDIFESNLNGVEASQTTTATIQANTIHQQQCRDIRQWLDAQRHRLQHYFRGM